jgi:iron complex outermembrane receptor protein
MNVAGIIAFIVIVLLCPDFGETGEERKETVSPVTMGQVVVTATRYEEETSSVPAHVSVITEEDIKNSTARNVPDLLRTQTGIQVSDITGNGRNFTVDLRGFGETAGLNTLVLVDGRRINEPDLSATDWTLITLDRVERVEIIRGGRGSVLYGDNAAGGVINIITKEGEAFRAGAEIAGGSYDTFRGNASVSGSTQNLSYAFSGSYTDSDGYRDNSETDPKDFGANLIYYVSDKIRLNLSGDYHKDKTGLPGAIRKSQFAQGVSRRDSVNPEDFSDTKDYYIKGGPEFHFLTDSLFKVDASFRERDFESFASFSGGSFTGDTEIKTVAVSPQLVLREKIAGLGNSLSMGFDYSNSDEDISNESIFFGVPSQGEFELGKKNYGYYIYDDISLLDNLSLSGGYRRDRAEFDFKPSSPDHKNINEDLFTAGVNYNFYKESYAYLSFSRSFRYPLLDELFNFILNTINTNLKQQRSDDYEIGIRHYFTETLYGNINISRIDTDDEIFLNPLTFSNENLGHKTRRDGVEVSLTKMFDRITLSGSYTFTDADIEGGVWRSNEVPNVPRHKATLDTIFDLGRGWTLAINGIYVGGRPFISDFANAFDDQEDYVLINTRVRYAWKHVSAFLDINNITDNEYSEYGVLGGFPVEEAFYPSPEINFLVGVSASF